MSVKSWEISDAFWEIVEPLIPKPKREKDKQYKRIVGGGRKPFEPRKVFSAIVYVLRTGIQWKALPKEFFGSPSAIHRYFLKLSIRYEKLDATHLALTHFAAIIIALRKADLKIIYG